MLRLLIALLENMLAVGEFNSPDELHGLSERRHTAAVKWPRRERSVKVSQ